MKRFRVIMKTLVRKMRGSSLRGVYFLSIPVAVGSFQNRPHLRFLRESDLATSERSRGA